MQLVDTHCHIDLEEFDDDRDQVIERAQKAGVRNLLVIGFEPERWQAGLELAARYRNIRVAAGLHPNSASRFDQNMLDDIACQTRKCEVVAIGETGIDLYWKSVPLDRQQWAFREQVSLARDLGLPFIVHQRDAEDEVLEVLESFQPPLNGVLHCFTSNWEYAERILNLGMHLGVGGAVTFKSRTDLHEAATRLPLDRLLLETDSPYMAPVPHRGKRNEPAHVSLVAKRISELRGISLEDLAKATTQNALTLFQGLSTEIS